MGGGAHMPVHTCVFVIANYIRQRAQIVQLTPIYCQGLLNVSFKSYVITVPNRSRYPCPSFSFSKLRHQYILYNNK